MPAGNSTGDDLWQVLRKFPNVIMVLSGHLTNGQAAHRSDVADNGNLVNQIFANYQTFPNGGDGWLRIITFHPSKNSISVKTFSPFLNRFKTDERNQFTVPYHNPHPHTGAGELSGMVRSASNCEPIAGATVSTDGASTTTDKNGRYSLSLAPGNHEVSAEIPGWSNGARSESVYDGFDTDLNFFLNQSAESPCPLNPESPSVTICSPKDGSVVSSPVNVVAATTDASAVTGIQALLDGNLVSQLQAAALAASLNAQPGNHHLTIKAQDKAGASFESSVDFSVSAPVVPGPPTRAERLSLSISPSQATIKLGHSADFAMQIGSDGSLKDPVGFSCSGLPAGTRCVFDPVHMNVANLPGAVKLTVFTNALTASLVPAGLRNILWTAILLPGLVLLGNTKQKYRRLRGVLLWMVSLMVLGSALLTGCHGIVTPSNKGSFSVTVTSSSGTVQKSSNISLTLE
jgi:Carboxypeptidase regulatory-like domain/Bacterial Ig domain